MGLFYRRHCGVKTVGKCRPTRPSGSKLATRSGTTPRGDTGGGPSWDCKLPAAPGFQPSRPLPPVEFPTRRHLYPLDTQRGSHAIWNSSLFVQMNLVIFMFDNKRCGETRK